MYSEDVDDDEKAFQMRHNIVDGIMINIRSPFFPIESFAKFQSDEKKKNPISQITFDNCQCLCAAARGIILNNMISKFISSFSSSFLLFLRNNNYEKKTQRWEI